MSSYNFGYIVGISAGFLLGILLILIFRKISRKDHSLRCKYDERQELIRGRGFKYAFFTLIIYEVICCFFGDFMESFAPLEFISFLGICIAIFVHAAYAIWNNAYFALNEKPKQVILILLCASVANILLGFSHIHQDDFIKDGTFSLFSLNLLAGFTTLALLIVLLIKQSCKKRAMEGIKEE